jgi:hypothetical protein
MAVERLELRVAESQRAPGVRIDGLEDLGEAVAALELDRSPVVVLVGGASNMAPNDRTRVGLTLIDALIPVVRRAGAIVVDGGTRAGVMELIGDAREKTRSDFPLVGVVVASLGANPGRATASGAAPLDPRHTHFVLVPGERWGDEAAYIAGFAAALAEGETSVTVVANGGDIAWDDVRFSIAQRRVIVVLAESGGTADELAQAKTQRARELHESGLLSVASLDRTAEVSEAVARALGVA